MQACQTSWGLRRDCLHSQGSTILRRGSAKQVCMWYFSVVFLRYTARNTVI